MSKSWSIESAALKLGDEPGRQSALERLDVLDSDREEQFDTITSLVRSFLDVPVAAVTLLDRDRQWFKSIQGLDLAESPRKVAICDHTIRNRDCLVVSDLSRDGRFHDNPLVTGDPHFRAYAGAPLVTPDGYAVGALCALDVRPREFTGKQVGVLADFAGLVMNQLELRQVADREPLTGLATRRAFRSAIASLIASCRRTSDSAALVIFDLDHFKRINDTFGHRAGDAVLAEVGRIVGRSLRRTDFAARIGGEEFAILMHGVEAEGAAAAADRLRLAIAEAVAPAYPDIRFTASFGTAMLAPGTDTPDDWTDAADRALYEAKAGGRNRVVVAGAG
ncbi:GGDEF domain-containing protein [Wenxinia marina]|uniref:diguanylate cyclase n=1 Tax=Wenxinia marina DSM 24838 TaxID=1123501 RepID=A0A0D0PYH4_9RHOB|nr:sensor domain-containing diguanylate cyclase [Wenxinia marina]KIQ67484.1 diguanylate cyclase with GAF sensor [Wenxinia marina DSM 24838]GGL69164.1 GGDEF domain-containing protein [Wenxinia marina]